MTAESTLHNPNSEILGVYAHPDDESFGTQGLITGGIVAKFNRDHSSAERFHAMVISEGEASTVYGEAGEDYVKNGNRVQESHDALDQMGVPKAQRKFLKGFKDSNLIASVIEISEEIRKYIEENNITDVVTFGEEGLDGQLDHIASFYAAKIAIASFREKDRPRLWSLNTTDDEHDVEFVVCENDKIETILFNWSQFEDEEQVYSAGTNMDDTGEINRRYVRLLRAEHYSLVQVGTRDDAEAEYRDWQQKSLQHEFQQDDHTTKEIVRV